MIIQINVDWRIASDPHEWIVQKRRVVKGRDKWHSLSFHESLDRAVLRLAQRQLRDLDTEYGLDQLSAFCQALDRLKDGLRAALRETLLEVRAKDPTRSEGANVPSYPNQSSRNERFAKGQ